MPGSDGVVGWVMKVTFYHWGTRVGIVARDKAPAPGAPRELECAPPVRGGSNQHIRVRRAGGAGWSPCQGPREGGDRSRHREGERARFPAMLCGGESEPER